MSHKTYTFADLFSGCGGLSYGFAHSKTFKGLLAVDSWKASEEVYSYNHPSIPFHCTDLSSEIEQQKIVGLLKGKCDLLIGGPPCQGFSTLGKRAPKCKLCTLVDSFFRIALRVQPSFILMENVRGFLSKNHPSGGTYPEAVSRYLGGTVGTPKYLFEQMIIDAQEYGLAQTRVRYIVVAVRKDIENSASILSAILLSLKRQKKFKRPVLRDVIGDLPHVEIGKPNQEILIGKNGSAKTIYNHESLNHSEALQKRFSYVPPGGGLLDVPKRLLTPHLKKMIEGHYGNGGHPKNIYGRLEWEKPCGTIVAGIDKITCGRFVHPEQNRLLTPRECARIQTFPDDFRFFGGLVTQYYLIGNAVPPSLSSVFANAFESAFNTTKINTIKVGETTYENCCIL